MANISGLVLGVDAGGTFTDVFTSAGVVVKVPSRPDQPAAAILAALRAAGVTPDAEVVHGTTVATNAVLERKGARTALLTTAGFEDVLEIRRQNRPSLYDLTARWPEPLVPRARRLGVAERLDDQGQVLRALDRREVLALAREVSDAEALAVCFLFSFANRAHERAAAEALRDVLGRDIPLSLSSDIAPEYGEFERTSTTVVNAYVMPIMRRYLRALRDDLAALGVQNLRIMHSSGGLMGASAAAERPVGTILSGPAAGVIGAQAVAETAEHDRLITFDMGGTSTDVAVVPGQVLEGSEGEVASFPLLVPMLTIETVGAGGGSVARVDEGGGLHVGPESAGADPGPAAYGRGELPTVTDANLVLGRLSPRGLLGGEMPLDESKARRALSSIAESLQLPPEQAAWAVVRLANSNMERAVRAVTLQRGYDPRHLTLVAFGGAGPLHAAEMAEGLGVGTVLVPPYPGVMAALGLTVPDLRRDFFRTVLLPLAPDAIPRLDRALAALEAEARRAMAAEERDDFGEIRIERMVDARYLGQSFELRLPYTSSDEAMRDAFTALYLERYGYALPDEPIEIVNVRVRAVAPRLAKPRLQPPWPEPPRPSAERPVWFGEAAGLANMKHMAAAVRWRPSLPPGTQLPGPAVLEQYDSTTLVPPEWSAAVDQHFNLVLTRC